MINLQKVILAVGIFSIFEARLQEGLNCSNGFEEAKKILTDESESDMKERFDDLISLSMCSNMDAAEVTMLSLRRLKTYRSKLNYPTNLSSSRVMCQK